MTRRLKRICAAFSAVAVCVLGAAVSSCALAADSIETVYQFDIAPGALDQSIKSFAKTTGVSIIFDNRIVRGRNAAGLSGAFRANEAMKRLLSDGVLDFRIISDRTWAITTLNEALPAHIIRPVPEPPPENSRDEIIVTTSHRAPSQQAGTRALYSLDGELSLVSGASNIAEPIYELPASVASVTSSNTALFVSAGGLNLADLRGLGTGRTLVLVNGRRHVRTSGGARGEFFGVDLNSIPAPFIERIEVVNQSAGASIGTDAVAGAINIVMRDEIDGAVVTADGGVSGLGDAGEYSLSALAGKKSSDGSARIAAGVAYASEPSLLFDQRPDIAAPYGFELDGRVSMEDAAVFAPGFGGSNILPNGRLAGIVTPGGEPKPFLFVRGLPVFSPDGLSFEPDEGRLDQLYNWTTGYAALPTIERLMGYATGAVETAGGHTIYADLHIAQSKVGTQIAPSPVSVFRGATPTHGDAIIVPVDNPFIPDGLLAAAEYLAGGPVSGVLVSRRFVELGPRRREIKRENLQTVLGVKGALGEKWNYDLSYQFGRTHAHDWATGAADTASLGVALDINACAATPGCSPINIFGSATITPEQADFIRADPFQRDIKIREQVAQLKLSGVLYEKGAAVASLTAGVEHHRERYEDGVRESESGSIGLGDFNYPGARGSVARTDFILDVSLPLAADRSGFSYLGLGGAYRYVKRHGASGFSNISGNAVWSPFDGLEFYAQAFRGGRAPNVAELFSAGPDMNTVFLDVCDGAREMLAIVETNCQASGPLFAPTGFQQQNQLTNIISRGNPGLGEEKVRSRLFGVSADIDQLTSFSSGALRISADWRHNRVSDIVNAYAPAQILAGCYESVGFSSPFCGESPVTGDAYIQRDPVSHQIVAIETSYVNGGSLRVSGLDARLRYFADIEGVAFADAFSVDVLYAYNHRARAQGWFDAEEVRMEGLAAFPRHQLHLTASLGTETVKTIWTVRRRGKAMSVYGAGRPEAEIPAVTYVDMAVQVRPSSNTILYAGIENLFDTDFPVVAFARNSYYLEYYDIIGRRFFAGVKAEF